MEYLVKMVKKIEEVNNFFWKAKWEFMKSLYTIGKYGLLFLAIVSGIVLAGGS